MEAGDRDVRGVPNVNAAGQQLQGGPRPGPGSGQSVGLRGDALAVRLTARQRDLKKLAGDLFGPVGLLHDAPRRSPDHPRTSWRGAEV